MTSLYKLRDWIDENKLNWSTLSSNENAIHLLEANPDKINWNWLSYNSNAVHLFKENKNKRRKHITCKINALINMNNSDLINEDKINLNMSREKYVMDYLEKNPDKIAWHWLSCNPAAIHILEKNLDESRRDGSICKIDWDSMSRNPNAVHLLQTHIDESKRDGSECKICWDYLCYNENAIELLKKNLDNPIGKRKIYWRELSMNPNPIAVLWLEKHQDESRRDGSICKIDWDNLSKNSGAMHLLEKYQEECLRYDSVCKINWFYLSSLPEIFELDYNFLRKRMNIIKEELIAKVMHPKRIQKWIDSGMDIEDI